MGVKWGASEGEGVHEGAFEGGADGLAVDADAGVGVEVAVISAGHALVVLDVEQRLLLPAADAEVARGVVEGRGGGADRQAAAEFGGGGLLQGGEVAVEVDVGVAGVADEELGGELALAVGGVETLVGGTGLAGEGAEVEEGGEGAGGAGEAVEEGRVGVAGGEGGVVGGQVEHEVADCCDVAVLLRGIGIARLAALGGEVELQVGVAEFALVGLEVVEVGQSAGDALLAGGEGPFPGAAADHFALGGGDEWRRADVVGDAVETAFKVDLGGVEQAVPGEGVEHVAHVAAAADSGAEVEVEGRTAANAVHPVEEGSYPRTALQRTVCSRCSACEVGGDADVGVVLLELGQH